MEMNILNKISELSERNPSIKIYLFGSSLQIGLFQSDIDLLIVYNRPEEPMILRMKLKKIINKLPIDLIFLTQEEERELDFINKVNAKEILGLKCRFFTF